MKKLFLVLVIAALVAGGAFAQHPTDQLGIGIVGSGGYGSGALGYGGGLSLYIPGVPIYWGFNFSLFYGLEVTGDYYFIDQPLVPDLDMGWFLGAGAYVNLDIFVPGFFTLAAAGRLPVGVYMMFVDVFEIGLAVVPTIGATIISDQSWRPVGLYWNVGAELWFRYWL